MYLYIKNIKTNLKKNHFNIFSRENYFEKHSATQTQTHGYGVFEIVVHGTFQKTIR